MTVFYRMCGITSTNPSPVYQEDKFKLNTLCLRSFVKAFKDVNPKMIFINDHCDGRYNEMIDRIVPFDKDIHSTDLGINGTALYQYQLAEQSEDDILLFQECDYIYQANGSQVLEAIKSLGLVSPYDHPDFYNRPDIHPPTAEVKIVNNYHFRISQRNTMTFGMTKAVFKDSKAILDKYGYLDNDVWYELSARGHKLYTPIPGFATHMVKDFLSPGIDWEQIWSNIQS